MKFVVLFRFNKLAALIEIKMSDPSGTMFSKALEAQVLQTTNILEEQIDAKIKKLDQMDEDDLELVKQRRLDALKKSQKQKQVTFML